MALTNERGAAEILQVTVSTVRRWRQFGEGPPFLKVGRAVRYDEDMLAAWLAEQVRTDTRTTSGGAA